MRMNKRSYIPRCSGRSGCFRYLGWGCCGTSAWDATLGASKKLCVSFLPFALLLLLLRETLYVEALSDIRVGPQSSRVPDTGPSCCRTLSLSGQSDRV